MTTYPNYPVSRLRRLRQNPRLRDLLSETTLSVNDLVLPLFISATIKEKKPILAMPGHAQLTLADLDEEIAEITRLNIPAIILFGIPAYKDAEGSAAWQSDGIIQQAIRRIKKLEPKLIVMTDLCCCEYTDHQHCGVLNFPHPNPLPSQKSSGRGDIKDKALQGRGDIVDNDATLNVLVKQAISHAEAGADIIAPSGMMDGAVSAIRQGLDQAGYSGIPILSYAVKYASALYGPFREAAESVLKKGDRRGYQMNPANAAEALREAALDIQEGADILMVKPAGFYLDVIYRIKQAYPQMPLAAYQISGEYAMIKAAGANGWIDEKQAALESLLAIKRAGADFIFTYFAKDVAQWLANFK